MKDVTVIPRYGANAMADPPPRDVVLELVELEQYICADQAYDSLNRKKERTPKLAYDIRSTKTNSPLASNVSRTAATAWLMSAAGASLSREDAEAALDAAGQESIRCARIVVERRKP